MAARDRFFGVTGAILLCGSIVLPHAADAASLDSRFRAAVQRLLLNLKEGPVSQMTMAERKDLAACVNQVFAGIPPQKKQYIIDAGSDMSELRARFDKVGNEDQAKLKQEVTRNCA